MGHASLTKATQSLLSSAVNGPSMRTTTTGSGKGTVAGSLSFGRHRSPVGLGEFVSANGNCVEDESAIKPSCMICGGRTRAFCPPSQLVPADSAPRKVADFAPRNRMRMVGRFRPPHGRFCPPDGRFCPPEWPILPPATPPTLCPTKPFRSGT